MAFSSSTVSHTFENADGTPASGACTFTLTDVMTNGTISLVPAELTANLNGSGVLSQVLTSNVDTATWTLVSTATSGSVELQFTGSAEGPLATAAISWNASAASVQAAIQALTALSALTTVAVSGGPLGSGTLTITGVPGNLTVALTANSLAGGSATLTQSGTGTTPAAPANTQWRCDLRVMGASVRQFYIVVPAGGAAYDLFALIPTTGQV
jgi:hypothetical protein